MLDEAKDGQGLHLYFPGFQGNLAWSLDIARQRGSGPLIATDLDRDGRTDVAMAHQRVELHRVLPFEGYSFYTETAIDAYQNAGRLNYFAAGDLNHDGCGDLVVSRWSQSPVLLYGQGCSRPRIADCRYPPMRGSGLAAVGLVSPLMREHNADVGANVREGLTRGSGVEQAVRKAVSPLDQPDVRSRAGGQILWMFPSQSQTSANDITRDQVNS